MSFKVLYVPVLLPISLMVRYDREGSQLVRLLGVLRQGGGMPEGLSWSAVNLISRTPSTGVGVRVSAADPPQL